MYADYYQVYEVKNEIYVVGKGSQKMFCMA